MEVVQDGTDMTTGVWREKKSHVKIIAKYMYTAMVHSWKCKVICHFDFLK